MATTAAAKSLAGGGYTGANRGAQRHQPSAPPAIFAISVALAERPAGQFSGILAKLH